MPENTPIGHTCFNPALPRLPLVYRIDVAEPMQLVPFGQFTTILMPIDICHDCWVYVLCNYNISMVNQWSGSPAAVALGGLTKFVGLVNSVPHPMFNDLNPPAFREGRSIVAITGHEARKGTRTRKPRLTYIVQYRILDDPRTSPPIRLPEFKLRQYAGAYKKVTEYWYGSKHHSINVPFVRSILAAYTPFANTAIWNKLPCDESEAVHWLHQNGRLAEWKPGTTKEEVVKREDSAQMSPIPSSPILLSRA